MTSEQYDEGYWEHGVGSNYVAYGDDPGWAATALGVRRMLADDDRPRLIEAGAAKGWFLRAAVAFGIDAHGMDVSAWAVQHCAPEMQGRLRLGNVAVDPLLGPTERLYDMACSWEFLEHVPVDELHRVLTNMERAVGWSGWMVHRIGIAVPGGSHDHQADVTHQPEQPREWWEDLFAGRGWTVDREMQEQFRAEFAGRDWADRFFVWYV
jgi:cyclopropane fatty-acyl-phospholipid synthase-like methyltransferase